MTFETDPDYQLQIGPRKVLTRSLRKSTERLEFLPGASESDVREWSTIGMSWAIRPEIEEIASTCLASTTPVANWRKESRYQSIGFDRSVNFHRRSMIEPRIEFQRQASCKAD